jgi:hypothetical protein
MRKIAHIVNPFKAKKGSELHAAQPIVFRSMDIASKFAAMLAKNEVEVKLFSAQFPEDRDFVPRFFTKTRDLDRSILDIVKAGKHRKLPLLKDILDRLYEASDAEFFIYTNSDIGVQPHFYLAVNEFINGGHNAFTITRRTMNKTYAQAGIYDIFSQVGGQHPGFDCFVFRKKSYPKYKIDTMCIGIPHIGKILLVNFEGVDKECKLYKDLHLTFHIGNSGQWALDRAKDKNAYSPYQQHNKRLLDSATKKLGITRRIK